MGGSNHSTKFELSHLETNTETQTQVPFFTIPKKGPFLGNIYAFLPLMKNAVKIQGVT